MSADTILRTKSKKLRLFSFWVEENCEEGSPWLRRSRNRNNKKNRIMVDLVGFHAEIHRSGVSGPQGLTLCNCEMTGGNDISLIYPWLHIANTQSDILAWLHQQGSVQRAIIDRPDYQADSEVAQVVSRGRRLRQGTFSIVETVVPSKEVSSAGEQLCVLLGFRTTEDNCVDTAEADSERCQEARSWRDWTGIQGLYQDLSSDQRLQVTKIEFLESHVPYHTAVFHYIVLVFLQVEDQTGKVGVLDTVARFRVRNMSGYVTLYYGLGEHCSVIDMIKMNAEDKQQARKQFFAVGGT